MPILETSYHGSPLYFLADDLGEVWLGGWKSLEVAEQRLKQATECNWTPEQMDCSVDVEMVNSRGLSVLREIRVAQRSSIPNARWCVPLNWEPRNEIENAEFVEGSWWSDDSEEAGMIVFTDAGEGDEIVVALDDLRVANCGDCKVIGVVEI